LKKKYFSSHKLPKQQSTSFWSQGILGVKVQIMIDLSSNPSALARKQLHGSVSFIWETLFIFIKCTPKPRV
jgi:hypothetical protein